MKIAVIGCGSIATSQHIPAYKKNKNVQIKYFCDIILERAQKAVDDYGSGIAVSDYKEVLADGEVEAISVCTPNNMHSIISIDALKAGKNVLCEKPAAKSYEEAIEMQKTQHETGKVLNIGVVNRFNAGIKKIKELIDNDDLGEVYQVYVSFRNHRSIPGLGGDFTNKSVAGGGVTIDWGVHFFDIVMFCCGDPKVNTVSAEKFCKLGNPIDEYTYETMWAGPPKNDGICDVEEGITGIIRTEGPIITFNGAWAQNIGEDEMFIDFIGTKGGIRLHYTKNFVFYSTKNGMLTKTTFKMNEGMEFEAMFSNEINSFINCIENGEKLPSHIDTNIKISQIMDAIYKSADRHCEITL